MTTFNVDGAISFAKALKSAQSGDTIALAPGAYSGLKIAELKVPGITITSQDPAHQAVLKNLVVYNANGLTFTGLEFVADAAKGDIPFKVAQSTNITFDHLNIHGSLDGKATNDVSAFAVYKSTGVVISNSEIQQLKNVVLGGAKDQIAMAGNNVHDISGVEVKTLTDTPEKPEKPETPEKPATPDKPDTPETPSTGSDHKTTDPKTDTKTDTKPETQPSSDQPGADDTKPTTGTKPPETSSGDARVIVATDAGGPLDGSDKGDAMKGGKGADILHGNGGNDLVSGGGNADTLFGDAGNDTLSGGDGNDVLQGGTGLNTLIGGGGADTFVFTAGDFEGGIARNGNAILDFSHAQGDRIDLSGLDAVAGTAANEGFTLIGSSAFHKVAGELRYEVSGKNVVLLGDTNGDGIADVKIMLTNASGSVTPGDVIL